MDTGCENCGQKPSLLYFQIKKCQLESWSENKFFPGYFVCILTTSMKNIYINAFLFIEYINAFLFIDYINEWENLPFIVRTSLPFVPLLLPQYVTSKRESWCCLNIGPAWI